MGGVVIEEKAINRAQYLDLVYSQMSTLYDLIPDAPCPSTNPTPTLPVTSHAVFLQGIGNPTMPAILSQPFPSQ
jgi:hypothetical protein